MAPILCAGDQCNSSSFFTTAAGALNGPTVVYITLCVIFIYTLYIKGNLYTLYMDIVDCRISIYFCKQDGSLRTTHGYGNKEAGDMSVYFIFTTD